MVHIYIYSHENGDEPGVPNFQTNPISGDISWPRAVVIPRPMIGQW